MIDFNDVQFLTGDRTQAYAALRAQGAGILVPGEASPPTWIVPRYVDVQALSRVTSARLNPLGTDAPPWIQGGATLDRLRGNLAQTDGTLHARLRSAVAGFFMPRKIEQLRAISAHSVARALQSIAGFSEEFDMVRHLAAQVPKGVICHLLNIPEADWERLIEVQHDYLLLFSTVPLTPEQSLRLEEVIRFYLDYFEGILQRTEVDGRSSFVQMLLAAEQRGEISRTETLCLMHTVLDAGFETTRTTISNTVELLALNPFLLEQLRAAPEGIDNAVEEILRVRTPVHARQRILVEPYTLSDGTEIPAGHQVLLMLQAADLDDEMFPEALRIDLRRANAVRHLAFGGGLHHCLGAPMARIQLQETLKGLAQNYTSVALSRGKGPRFPSLIFPGLAELWITAERA